MIAVSQNMVLGNPVASLVGAIAVADGPTAEGSAFLQAFALADVAPVVAEDINLGPDTKPGAVEDVLDGPDDDPSIEALIADGAIWQPIAQTIATLPIPVTGAAALAKEAAADVTPVLLSKGDLPAYSKIQADLIGETLPQPRADAAFKPDRRIEPNVGAPAAIAPAVVFNPDVEVPKPAPAFAPSLAVASSIGTTPKALEPARSAPLKVITPDTDSSQRQDVAPNGQHRPAAPEQPMSPAGDMLVTPAEPAKRSDPAPDVTIYDQGILTQKPPHIARVSASESAWRQKWIGDVSVPSGVDASVSDQGNIFAKTDAVSAMVPLAALALPSAKAGKNAVMPKPGDPANTPTTVDFAPAADPLKRLVSDTKATNQFVAAAPLERDEEKWNPVFLVNHAIPQKLKQDDVSFKHHPALADSTAPIADATLGKTVSFEAIDAATRPPAAIPQPANSPLPLPSPSPPTLPAAVSPTIVEMTKSGNDGPLELALSPEELGRLTISIKHDGDFVRVTVIADRPETLDLMRRHGGDLLADLRQAGFSGASLSFGQGGQGGQPRFTNAEAFMKSQSTPQHLPPETKPTAPNRSRKGSGVDLRF